MMFRHKTISLLADKKEKGKVIIFPMRSIRPKKWVKEGGGKVFYLNECRHKYEMPSLIGEISNCYLWHNHSRIPLLSARLAIIARQKNAIEIYQLAKILGEAAMYNDDRAMKNSVEALEWYSREILETKTSGS